MNTLRQFLLEKVNVLSFQSNFGVIVKYDREHLAHLIARIFAMQLLAVPDHFDGIADLGHVSFTVPILQTYTHIATRES